MPKQIKKRTSVTNSPAKVRAKSSTENSKTVMTVVTILLLFFFPLFGLIVMWVWTQWSKTIKWVITGIFGFFIFMAIPLAITLIAINPAHQFAQANNTKRRSDTLQILNAIGQYNKDKNELPAEITELSPNIPTELSSTTSLQTLCEKLIGTYIATFPTDPLLNTTDVTSCSGSWKTGYAISRDEDNRVTVSAITTDEDHVIQVTR